LVTRLLKKLPLSRKVVALIARNFTLLESITHQLESLAPQLGEAVETQRMALEDRTAQLEASAQLIEIARVNAATLVRLEDIAQKSTKDLQQSVGQLEESAQLIEIGRRNVAALARLEDTVLQIKKDFQDVSKELVSANARAWSRIEDGFIHATKGLENAAQQLQRRGAIYIPANAYETANPEVGLLTYLSGSVRSRVALDIGAHVGEFSRRLLECGMSVHAFEPFPSTFAELSDRLAGRPGFTAHPIAIGYTDREMDLYIASTTTSENRYEDVRQYNSLVRHSMLDCLTFANAIKVTVRSLQSLHASREIPDNIGVIKIDAEGYDLEIIHGLGDCTSDILMTEFWDNEHPFGKAGAINRLDDSARELQKKGFSTYLIIYRDASSSKISFYCNVPTSVRGSWGNAIFFKDPQLFTEARRWCASVLPPTFFGG
jgi:FkbM family methyltransferase